LPSPAGILEIATDASGLMNRTAALVLQFTTTLAMAQAQETSLSGLALKQN
jgi:hypothetical protein